jgi:2-phospho-L-lactate guanylyltransferase
MSAPESSTWTLVVPVKTLVAAKTRLSAAAGPYRAALAVAIACDTVEAALSCTLVARVVVVTGDPVAAAALGEVGAHVVDDPEAGLNAALRRGAQEAVRLAPADAVGALQADLPALRPVELALVLTAAAEFDQMFLPDAVEVGTTFYGVRPGVPFTPGFGGESRDRHLRRGAKELQLDGIDSIRRDVDTPDDLQVALALGVGPRTTAVVAKIRKSSAGEAPSVTPDPAPGRS